MDRKDRRRGTPWIQRKRGPPRRPAPCFLHRSPRALRSRNAATGSGDGRLRRIYSLALATGHLDCLVVFGSYVSDMAEPNDVDVILVMQNDFVTEGCPADSRVLLDHSRAHDELRASVFWVRPDLLLGEPLEQFLAHWERKRDGRRRGIVEVRP